MAFGDYSFDARLANAETPPPSWYTDPEILRVEHEKIFSRTWQLAGRIDQVAAPGDYFTATIGNEPVVVVRGADEKLRAFSNVCRHRAGPVASGSGNCKTLRCLYHSWTYSLEGRLLGTPEFEGVACFDRAQSGLPQVQVDTWGPLVFVNVDSGAGPLDETLGDLPDRIGLRNVGGFRPAARKDWYLDCNWKVYVDNYLEGYHIPSVHPGLFRELDYVNYRTETSRLYSIQHSPIKQVEDGRIRTGDADFEAQFFWVFPNLMVNVYPDNYSTNLIVPLGPERTLTVFEWYFRNTDGPEMEQIIRDTVELSDEIQVEDISICEAVQRGLRSRLYRAGRYSVARENGVHHFHGLLSEYLNRP